MRRFRWYVGAALSTLAGCSPPPPAPSCNENDPNKTFYRDEDTDGFGDPAAPLASCDPPAGYVDNDLDCDDTDERINPETPWHPDADGDGFGDGAIAVTQCVKPMDHTLDGSDCQDLDAAVGATLIWYADADSDGFGDPDAGVASCAQPAGRVSNSDDCDDTDPALSPYTEWYPDLDGDGFGAGAPVPQCTQPAGHSLLSGDCDDGNAALSPATVWYLDDDGDGWGDPAVTVVACEAPAGHVLDGIDCDDGDAAVKAGGGDCPFDFGGKSCKEVLEAGNSKGDGAYLVDLDGAGGDPAITVWCDMTTDGGGWTALLNPTGEKMPTQTIPNLAFMGAVIGGVDLSCSSNVPVLDSTNGWWSLRYARCGTATIETTITWVNAIGAKDLMFNATLAGQTAATITADGVDIPGEVTVFDVGGGKCEFHNGTGASLVPPLGECYKTWLDAPPAVHDAAFDGTLSLVLTTGPACSPTCQYVTGHFINQLFVR